MTVAIRCLLPLLLLMPAAVPAWADEVEQLAATVPADVTEVVSGGVWTHDGASGYYRAMVITPGPSRPGANVVVQMLSVEKADATPKLKRSVILKEVADQKIANAFLAIDAENENEMTLIVTSYGGGSDQDTAIHFKFDAKGDYKTVAPAVEEAPAGRDPAAKN